MSCLLTTGFPWDCKAESGGVKAIWLVEFNSGDTITKSSGEVTVHSLTGGRTYFKYELEKETASYSWKTMPSQPNGTVAYEADLSAKIMGITTAKRNELKLLAKTRLRMVVEDNEGKFWLNGSDYGCELQETTTEFGTSFQDHKGTTINIKHRETDLPALMQSAVVTSLGLT